MKSVLTKSGLIAIIALLPLALSTGARAGSACKVKYSWNTGNSMQGTFKNYSKTISLEGGQVKAVGKKRMNYVTNLESGDVKFYLDHAADVTLAKAQRNPPVGNYVGSVELVKLKCLETSSAPPVEIEVIQQPAPPGGEVPVAVPKVRSLEATPEKVGIEKK